MGEARLRRKSAELAGTLPVPWIDVKAGNEHSANHSLPGLLHLLDGLAPGQRPRIVRRGCGSDLVMRSLEERGQPYLFRQGWEGIDSSLSLGGWRGFTTPDLHRCRLSARAVALAYNWWSLYVRLANPKARREAITSRSWLITSVGRRTEHAGQTTATLTAMHGESGKARDALIRVSRLLQGWGQEAAEQLDGKTVWVRCCEHLGQILAAIGPPKKAHAITFASG